MHLEYAAVVQAMCGSLALRVPSPHSVWDFSLYDLEVCASVWKTLFRAARYVPAGFLPYTSFSAPRAWVNYTSASSQLIFFGARFLRTTSVNFSCFPDNTLFIRSIWNDQEWTRFVQMHSIFLNVHKTCNDRELGGDSVRFARILNTRGLVISQTVNTRDMLDFEGIVDFVPLHELAERHRVLAAMSPTEREHLAQVRYGKFKARHSPHTIFGRAGIYRDVINHSSV